MGSAPGALSPLFSHDSLQAPAGLRSRPRGVLRAPARAAADPDRPRGRAPRRAGEIGRPPGGWGRAGRPGEEAEGSGGGGGEPRRQGGGDRAWKGGCTRICMKHRLGAGGSGNASAAHGPDRPSKGASERAGKEEGSWEARLLRRRDLRIKATEASKVWWGLDFPSWRRYPNSHPVRKPKLSAATPRPAAAASTPRSGPARPGAVVGRPLASPASLLNAVGAPQAAAPRPGRERRQVRRELTAKFGRPRPSAPLRPRRPAALSPAGGAPRRPSRPPQPCRPSCPSHPRS